MVLACNADPNMRVPAIAVSECTAGSHSDTGVPHKHFVERDSIIKSLWNPRPDVERRARIIDVETQLAYALGKEPAFRIKFIAESSVIIRISHQHPAKG